MNAEDKKRFEQLRCWIDNCSLPEQLELMWLCSKVEELEVEHAAYKDNTERYCIDLREDIKRLRIELKHVDDQRQHLVMNSVSAEELTKVKGQRDRLRMALDDIATMRRSRLAQIAEKDNMTNDLLCVIDMAEEALAELEKEI